jgi:hypothetical protein
MAVIPFRRPPSRRSFARPVEPPAALSGGSPATSSPVPDVFEDRRRMQQNWAALAVVVVLLALGVWLIDRLQAYSRTLACIESGHRNCMPLSTGQPR